MASITRREKRRAKREAEKASVEAMAGKLIDNLLNSFYATMRENNIGKDRAYRIIEETASKLNYTVVRNETEE